MPTVKPLLLLLIVAIVLTGMPPASAPVPVRASAFGLADEPLTYHGVFRYQIRGPAASPYGIGTSFLVGAAIPVAMARVRNALQRVIELASRVPGAQDEPAMETVYRWMNEGIPIDLAEELPVSGSYKATVTFALEEQADGTFQLQRGQVRWTTSNMMHLRDGEITLSDSFGGSGSHTLDPARDTILVRVDNKDTSPTFELEMEVHHLEPVDGKSQFSGPAGTFMMTLDASGGEMVIDAQALGVPISAIGAPTPMTVIEAPGIERSVAYAHHGPLDELKYHIETWTDAFDNQVLVEYDISTSCEARIATPETDAVLTYTEDDPGVLEFTVEAKTEPWNLQEMLADLTWTFPEIPDSELTTDPEDARGPQVTVRYEGLPANNRDFGKKTIEATSDANTGCDDPEPIDVRVFFPRDADNNPDGEYPNWYYYWKQTQAAQGHSSAIVYDAECPDDQAGYYLGFKMPEEADRIYVCDLAPCFSSTNGLTYKPVAGIDMFASVILHEWTHLENRNDWWPDGHDPSADADDDWVPDDRESAYGLDPLNQDTLGLGMRDMEVPAYLQEHTWPNGSVNIEDWANPGKQSGDGGSDVCGE